MARLNRRHQREQHGRTDANRYTQSKNPPIELSGIIDCNAWAADRRHQNQSITAPVGDHDSTGGCDQRKKQAFGEKLFNQPPTPGAEREPHGHFMTTR